MISGMAVLALTNYLHWRTTRSWGEDRPPWPWTIEARMEEWSRKVDYSSSWEHLHNRSSILYNKYLPFGANGGSDPERHIVALERAEDACLAALYGQIAKIDRPPYLDTEANIPDDFHEKTDWLNEQVGKLMEDKRQDLEKLLIGSMLGYRLMDPNADMFIQLEEDLFPGEPRREDYDSECAWDAAYAEWLESLEPECDCCPHTLKFPCDEVMRGEVCYTRMNGDRHDHHVDYEDDYYQYLLNQEDHV